MRRPLWRRLTLTTGEGRTYLDRRGLQTRWFNVYLHRIEAPDPGRDLHNHPWWFAALVLRGGYREQYRQPAGRYGNVRSDGARTWGRWSFHAMPLTTWHRIVKVEPRTLTLVVTGPYRQHWGFDTADGFVPHEAYNPPGYLKVDDNDATATREAEHAA